MNLFFEESGEFKVGQIMGQAGEAFQVELPSGKRVKVRGKDVLFQFSSDEPAGLLASARQTAESIDLDFLWEVAGEDEFDYISLGQEYFGHEPEPEESAALLIRLHSAPMYFYRKGKGRYKGAPEKALKAALAGIEKKRQQAVIQQQYVDQMLQGTLPDAIRDNAVRLLCKPDKNGIEYKALMAVCEEQHLSAEKLLLHLGGLPDARTLHLSRFIYQYFPQGTGFPDAEGGTVAVDLPVSDIDAFSIDDITTTEIDDALSVTALPDGRYRIGVHIAAPALGMAPGDSMDAIARRRLSTVYMPGDKITMLPDSLVDRFTLGAGEYRPALSLYAVIDPSDWSVVGTESRAEKVRVVDNLRHNDLDSLVTAEKLATGEGDYPHKEAIHILWQCTQAFEKQRMLKRESFGLRPEQVNRVDFNFYVSEDGTVTIERRQRSAPLDRIVAEMMIFANSTWGRLMADCGVPGIYRSQVSGGWGNRLQVKMVTHAAPHQGLGVDQYAWCTSPLRRYTDLVNQWQVLACIQHGKTAPLTAPFRPKDADLFAIVSAFDAAYTAYGEFQSRMERYWCLKWLEQHQVHQADAVVIRDEVVRLVEIPLVIPMPGMQVFARGTQVSLELIDWDEVELTVQARFLEGTAESPAADDSAGEEDEGEDPVA
ncbi:MAG: RNB domain-containing ribonuclease [Oxalobacter sp.]|nr:RNB domain-containing ribonuclease [Oxalobacter sp.]